MVHSRKTLETCEDGWSCLPGSQTRWTRWCLYSLNAEDKMNPIPSPTLALLKSHFYHCLTEMLATLYSPACSTPVVIKRRASSLTAVMIRFRGICLVFFSSFTPLHSRSFSMLEPRWPLFVPRSCWGQLSRTLQLLLCLENLPFRALSWSTVTTQVVTQRHQSLSLLKLTPLLIFPVLLIFP